MYRTGRSIHTWYQQPSVHRLLPSLQNTMPLSCHSQVKHMFCSTTCMAHTIIRSVGKVSQMQNNDIHFQKALKSRNSHITCCTLNASVGLSSPPCVPVAPAHAYMLHTISTQRSVYSLSIQLHQQITDVNRHVINLPPILLAVAAASAV